MLGLAFRRPRKRFAGTWRNRLDGLFDCEVEYAGKTVLDVGCNMGIVAYEVSKRRPAFIHGIDRERSPLTVARWIFNAVEVPSQFDRVELANARKLRSTLHERYDVVLFLSVYHHIRRRRGLEAANTATRMLAEACAGELIAKTTPVDRPEMFKALRQGGMVLAREYGKFKIFRRDDAKGVSAPRP